MRSRSVCLHGHFYQPPRENPWLEEVEVQDSARPYHDWNARITAECYEPNGAPRLLSDQGRITDIGCNYEFLSFNFGPTLLTWMNRAAPEVYARVLWADALSRERHHGRGNAIAQAYGHPILPLCSRRDKRTQILWGIADFRARFGRSPEGMWLPECAVDTETLSELAAQGIRFTVLAQTQARRVREERSEFRDTPNGSLDPTQPYRVSLPGGKQIAVFFSDQTIARSLAFGDALRDSESLLARLRQGFDDGRAHRELLTVAVDGETFGHHRRGAEEVLYGAFRKAGEAGLTFTTFGQYLAEQPPTAEVEIVERSSWSCAHGIERWRSDCGCREGGPAHWHQKWRAPLRAALDELSLHLASHYEEAAGRLLKDPWAARDEYVEVLLDRRAEQVEELLARHAAIQLSEERRTTALKLLEMQRHALLMFTSCGFFFSEVSGLEAAQLLRYAARAMQLAMETEGPRLEPLFLSALARAPSNLPEYGNAAGVYERLVKPAVVTLSEVIAHAAIAGLLGEPSPQRKIYCYQATFPSYRRETAGPSTLVVGRVKVASEITLETTEAAFGVLHFGGSDVRAAMAPYTDAAAHAELEAAMFEKFQRFSLTEVVRGMDRRFAGRDYSLRNLFIDDRRRLALALLSETLARHQTAFEQLYQENRRLVEYLLEISSPIPAPLKSAAQVSLSARAEALVRQLCQGTRPAADVHASLVPLFAEAQRLGIALDLEGPRQELEELLRHCPFDRPLLEILELADGLGLGVPLREVQNRFWTFAAQAPRESDEELLLALAERLSFDRRAVEKRLVVRTTAGRMGGSR